MSWKTVKAMKYYMGIVGLGDHDAAAAIVDEYGNVLAAAEEERYTRVKFDPSFPINSIKFCLKRSGIELKDITAIGFYLDPRLFAWKKFKFAINNLNHLPGLIKKSKKFKKFLEIEKIIRSTLGFNGPIELLQHHLCHASSVFFASPFTEATIISIDGVGEWETAWIGSGAGKEIKYLESTFWPHSLGEVYAAITQFLGFKYNSDEYKVMGLSAYGQLSYYDDFKEIIGIGRNRHFVVGKSYFGYPFGKKNLFSKRFEMLFGEPNLEFKAPSERDKNLAASLQKRIEDAFCAYVAKAISLTGIRKLCVTGGVALNCLAIGKLIEKGLADSVFLAPASSDAGCALGAAYHLAIMNSENFVRTPLKNAYLGDSFSEKEIEGSLKQAGLKYAYHAGKITDITADIIAKGNIVGWFQGRTEYGQRALGARSILANPMIANMKDIVNAKVKYREPFRPLAPSVLAEAAEQYFCCDGHTSPFMTHTFKARPDAFDKIPAVIHIDGTARVQTVTKEANGIYYELIKKVGERTGHPVVLNTSFNVKGEPIVNSPLDAINCFLKTDLDALAIGGFLVVK